VSALATTPACTAIGIAATADAGPGYACDGQGTGAGNCRKTDGTNGAACAGNTDCPNSTNMTCTSGVCN